MQSQESQQPKQYNFCNQTIHYNNGRYQGGNNNQLQPQGIGIAIDDQFNFFISQWHQAKLSGKTMINFAKSQIAIYGDWKGNLMKGLNTIKIDSLTIYCKGSGKSNLEWENPCVIEDSSSKLIYVVEIHQVLNSSLPQIRILNRISNNHHNLKSICGMFKIAVKEQSEDPLAFLQLLTELQPNLQIQQCINSNNSIFFGYKAIKMNDILTQALGMQLALRSSQSYKNSFKTLSLGSYNRKVQLHGIGMSTNKSDQQFLGIFKDGLMTKQFSVTENLSSHRSSQRNSHRQNNIPSSNFDNLIQKQVLRDIRNEHLKSINFLNSYLYFPSLVNLKGLIVKIQNYIRIFEAELKKHNPKTQDTFIRSENQELQSSLRSNSAQFNKKYNQYHKSQISFNQKQPFKSQEAEGKQKSQNHATFYKVNENFKAKGLFLRDKNPNNCVSSLSSKDYRSSLDKLSLEFQSFDLNKIKLQRDSQHFSNKSTKDINAKKKENVLQHSNIVTEQKQAYVLMKKNPKQIKNIQILNIYKDQSKLKGDMYDNGDMRYFTNSSQKKGMSPNRKPGFIYSRSKSKLTIYQDTAVQVPEIKKSVKPKQVKSRLNSKQKNGESAKNNTPPRVNNKVQIKRSPLKSAKNNYDDLPTSRVQKKQVYFQKNSPSKNKKDYISWQL